MTQGKKPLLVLILTAALSLFIWHKFSYPQLAFIDLSVDQKHARAIAHDFLTKQNHYSIEGFSCASIFSSDKQANRFLQKVLGFNGLLTYTRKHDVDLFYWNIRFFKEKTKEEFLISISSRTGEILSFRHIIEETAARKDIDKPEAKAKAVDLLKKRFSFNPDDYLLTKDSQKKQDNRLDFSFEWEKNGAAIQWSTDPKKGSAKLQTRVNVSGDEILSFGKNILSIPDAFMRNYKEKKALGNNIVDFIKIFYFFLLFLSIYFVVSRRHYVVMHYTKKFYVSIAVFSFGLSLFANFNFLQLVLYNFQTSLSLKSYVFSLMINTVASSFFLALMFLLPSLAGESLHQEVFREKKEGAFLHYLRSTFLSKDVAEKIIFGYFSCIILLGIQSALIKFGRTYLGVWTEHNWLTQISTAYWPLIAALTLGFKASFSEELTFRLFALSWGKKAFKNIIAAAVFSSMIWGFAHSNYPVFPSWFRGVEVSILGLFLCAIYLRFGLISVLVAHYLFDVFWASAGYLLGHSQPSYFFSSLFVLLIPLFFALIAFLINKKKDERPLVWDLNKHQHYNVEILKTFLRQKASQEPLDREKLKKELISHGWDPVVIDHAWDSKQHN